MALKAKNLTWQSVFFHEAIFLMYFIVYKQHTYIKRHEF